MSFFKSSLLVALFLLFGRLSGFGREWMIAHQGGASEGTDVAIVLLTFPDLMVNLLLGGGVTAALVPAFKRLDQAKAVGLYLFATVLVGALFAAIAAGVSLFPADTLALLAPGMSDETITSASRAFQWANAALPLTAVSGVAVAFLNANQRFPAGASGTLIFNSCIIAFILTADNSSFVRAIVTGVVAGAALRLLIQALALRPLLVRPVFSKTLIDAGLVWRFLGGLGFVSVLALIAPAARAFASAGAAGDLSLFNYSQKLIELPMAVVISAIITVLLPRLSAMIVKGDLVEAEQTLGTTLRVSLLILLSLAIPSALFPEALIRMVFFGSTFSDAQMATFAGVAQIGFLVLPFQGALLIYGSVFTAYSRPFPPVAASVLMLAALLAFSPYAFEMLQLKGVMLVYVGIHVLGAAFLTSFLYRTVGKGLFVAVFRNFPLSFLAPAAVCIAIGLTGRSLQLGLAGQVAFCILAFAGFAGALIVLDMQARSMVAGTLRRVKGG